jgi:hypothetical protein
MQNEPDKKTEKLLRLCIPRDTQAKRSPIVESEESKSRFYDPGTGIELRLVFPLSDINYTQWSVDDCIARFRLR